MPTNEIDLFSWNLEILKKDGSVKITEYHVKEISVRGRLKLPRIITL